VPRAKRGQTIAHDNPISRPTVGHAALPARLAHQGGVVAFAGDRELDRVEGRKHIKNEETAVARRDGSTGRGTGRPHQKSIVAGRIDHQKVIAALDRTDGSGEVGDLRRLVGLDRATLGALDAVMRRQLKLNTCALGPELELNTWARGPGATVLDVMG